MRYRFYITALSSRIEVFPLNHWKTSLVDERDDGKVYYRRKFSGSLQFTDNNGGDDFSLFYLIEVNSPYERLILEIEEKDSGADTYHNYWTGHFSTTDGKFDLDNCTFDVTPKPYDNYTNFDIYGDKEYNIFSTGAPDNDIETSTLLPAVIYNRNFWLIDVIEYMVQNIEPTAVITSNFLNNATNPITNDINKYRYLMLAQKSDIKRPASSNPATSGILSFNSLMSMLRMLNLYWDYDGTTFRIEHYDYWDGLQGIDLTNNRLSQRQNKYSYLKVDMPMYEKFSFMEANDTNYTPHIISYDPNCTNKESKIEYSYNITTDLDFIYNCVNNVGDFVESMISDDGWVLIANFYDGVDYHVYYGTAYNNATASNNYVLSWSYLLRTLFMHGRVLMSGEIENSPIDFISVIKTKQQDIKAIVCYEDDYDPNDYITTELGETWFGGQKGYVKQATIHPDGKVEFTLLYGEDKNITPTLVPLYKTLHCVVDLPRYVYSCLSEPNLVDTYYTVLFDEGEETEECLEILIPAGVVYQRDIADTEHTTVDGIYTEHSSLNGWGFVYNDNEVWVEISDCGSPPPLPGAPPADPVMFGATQSDQWACVEVGWSEPATTSYFELYRSIDGGDYELVDTLALGQNPYDDCLSQNHDYRPAEFCYKVKACNVAGCSGFSDVVCVDVNIA